jgi:hypothetical protein
MLTQLNTFRIVNASYDVPEEQVSKVDRGLGFKKKEIF